MYTHNYVFQHIDTFANIGSKRHHQYKHIQMANKKWLDKYGNYLHRIALTIELQWGHRPYS